VELCAWLLQVYETHANSKWPKKGISSGVKPGRITLIWKVGVRV
jgi:hypothetical protein